jgi:hypothetical protein
MNTTEVRPPGISHPVIREYDIRGTKYIVKATVTDRASEDAAAKVRRMIRNDMGRKAGT